MRVYTTIWYELLAIPICTIPWLVRCSELYKKAGLVVPFGMNHFSMFSVDIVYLCLMQEEFDTYDHNAHLFVKLQFLKKRSKIIEIVAAKDIIFALAHSGLCAAFSRGRYSTFCKM